MPDSPPPEQLEGDLTTHPGRARAKAIAEQLEPCPTCGSVDPGIVQLHDGYASQSSRYACPDSWHSDQVSPSIAEQLEPTVEKYCPTHGRYKGADRPENDCPDCEQLEPCARCGEPRDHHPHDDCSGFVEQMPPIEQLEPPEELKLESWRITPACQQRGLDVAWDDAISRLRRVYEVQLERADEPITLTVSISREGKLWKS